MFPHNRFLIVSKNCLQSFSSFSQVIFEIRLKKKCNQKQGDIIQHFEINLTLEAQFSDVCYS